ncbi:MAG: hypothetical protein HQK83_14920 [Fibrobacteria bacterium]|nr:hypothetical protein [Fibrobacteria bacterium]
MTLTNSISKLRLVESKPGSVTTIVIARLDRAIHPRIGDFMDYPVKPGNDVVGALTIID